MKNKQYVIAVLVHGHVLALETDRISEEDGIWFSRGITIRRWGTTKGLGQLAKGPMSASVLDPINAPGFIPRNAIIYYFVVVGWEEAMATVNCADAEAPAPTE